MKPTLMTPEAGFVYSKKHFDCMPKISVVINCDTRNQRDEQTGLFNGTVNLDFLDSGVFNKVKFFDGFDIETIVFVDEHEPVPEKTLTYLRAIADTVVVRKHTSEEKFNDWNYVSALSLCRGEYIAHFDQDVAAFARNKEAVQELIDLLDNHSFISYPSPWSPNPVVDANYDYWWCSTRFFMCKRETLDITELGKCLRDMDYLYGKYPASVKNPWTEHILGLMAKYNGNGVYYPPIDTNKRTIFTWDNYETYTLTRLNEFSYDEIFKWHDTHPIFYPCNVRL